jgi:hypothetical protein
MRYLPLILLGFLSACAGSPYVTASCNMGQAHGGGQASIIRQSCVTIITTSSPPTNTVTTTVTVPTSATPLTSSLITNGNSASATGAP